MSASKHKLAAEVFGLLRQASPGSDGLTLCVFVDLNAPPEATEVIAQSWTVTSGRYCRRMIDPSSALMDN